VNSFAPDKKLYKSHRFIRTIATPNGRIRILKLYNFEPTFQSLMFPYILLYESATQIEAIH
jgi:hypothetical protein